MTINLQELSVLSNVKTSKVFDQVINRRKLRFGELVKAVPDVDRDQARDAVVLLKNAHLVAESTSSIEDFNLLYVTADGLEAHRKLG